MARLSKETIEQIPILYAKYHNKSQVARELGISPGSVSRYLSPDENCISKKRTTITTEMEEQINQYYSYCTNLAETARHFNIAATTVKAHLSEENLQLAANQSEDKEALCYYIFHLFNDQPVSPWNLTQIEKFKRQGINYKAQLLTLKYWYEVKGNTTEKSNGSIGIIPYIAADSRSYYLAQLKKKKETEEAIRQQLLNDRQTVNYNPREYWSNPRKKKKEIDLSTIEGDD